MIRLAAIASGVSRIMATYIQLRESIFDITRIYLEMRTADNCQGSGN